MAQRKYGSSEKVRWRNHKSHIRKGVPSCELTKHFKDDHVNHPFARDSAIAIYDNNLKQQLNVIIIDQISDQPNVNKLKKREAFWQSQLRTYTNYGGFNKRDPRSEKGSKVYLTES